MRNAQEGVILSTNPALASGVQRGNNEASSRPWLGIDFHIYARSPNSILLPFLSLFTSLYRISRTFIRSPTKCQQKQLPLTAKLSPHPPPTKPSKETSTSHPILLQKSTSKPQKRTQVVHGRERLLITPLRLTGRYWKMLHGIILSHWKGRRRRELRTMLLSVSCFFSWKRGAVEWVGVKMC